MEAFCGVSPVPSLMFPGRLSLSLSDLCLLVSPASESLSWWTCGAFPHAASTSSFSVLVGQKTCLACALWDGREG